jgi:hypothetical protein
VYAKMALNLIERILAAKRKTTTWTPMGGPVGGERYPSRVQYKNVMPIVPSEPFTMLLFFSFSTVKRVNGKLRQPDQMNQYSSIRGTEDFFDMQIELIRRVLMMKMEYLKA